ncbi:hypothetical protein ACJRO7_015761 [Eucalyptus globulus]|uniref:Uncharacterized protein n=1 Tax=Eucalyptus globulus TaxID=34317 RepID=A0ABD3L5N9_EUCGL
MELSPEKRPDPEAAGGGGGGFAGALTGFLADSDEEGGLSPELPIEEELVEKVMHELYEEIAGRNDSTGVAAAPPPPALVEEKGKNGNCGASVSETASTVMAGVHFACCAGELGSRPSPSPSPSLPPSGGGEASGEADGGGGGDGVEMDDEWLEKALSWVPLMEGLGGY